MNTQWEAQAAQKARERLRQVKSQEEHDLQVVKQQAYQEVSELENKAQSEAQVAQKTRTAEAQMQSEARDAEQKASEKVARADKDAQWETQAAEKAQADAEQTTSEEHHAVQQVRDLFRHQLMVAAGYGLPLILCILVLLQRACRMKKTRTPVSTGLDY